jgi:acyl carrier protein
MNQINDKIRNVMAVVFEMELDQISYNAEPGVISSWDSLRHMNLIVALEEEFGIQFTDDEMTDLLNFKLISAIITEKLN